MADDASTGSWPPTRPAASDPDLVPTELHGAARIASRPERIGPYRLIDLLGEGGMGTVYLAEQSEPLPRRVALKLMRWGDAHGEAIRRFELEREAMARMSHPAIAQVFDAGATEHGQPYVVLEHIPGLPITSYCDLHRLDLRQRLDLLVTVCDGVRHAHEKGVIHRDLKPSNILVADGRNGPAPKIIDFGIAKALEPWSPSSGSATASRSRLGSPGYMSPEAILAGSRAIDTRSDVYSLGVVLCELLIGVRPFPTNRPSVREIRDAAEDPMLPSQRWRALPAAQRRTIAEARGLDESRLLRALRSELDWVVLRAVATDPDQRYGSAADLAADIGRWARGHLVEARPPSLAYRARKTVQRHATAFVTAFLILTTIVGFGIRTSILHHRAEAARDQAEALVGFMLDDLSTRLEPLGRLDLLEAVSRESLAYFESAVGDDLGHAGRHPAAALRQIGEVLEARGDLDAAFEAFERARQIDRRRLDERPSEVDRWIDLAADLGALSGLLEARGDGTEARARADEAERRLREALVRFPQDASARQALAHVLSRHQAELHRARGDVDGAVAAYDEARRLAATLLVASPDDAEIRHLLGGIHYGTGLLTFFSRGDAATAIEHFDAGIAVYRELAELQPEAALWRYRLAVLHGQGLAASYDTLEQPTEALAASSAALAILDQLVREEPSHAAWAHALGWEWVRQGGLAGNGGDLAAAAEAFRRGAEVQEAVIARSAVDHTRWLDGLAVAYEGLAAVRFELGEAETALTSAEAALAARRRAHRPDAPNLNYLPRLVSSAVGVAELRLHVGDLDGAETLLAESGEQIARLAAQNPQATDVRIDLAEASLVRGELLQDLDRGAEAEHAITVCLDLLAPLDPADPWVAELRTRATGL